MFLKGRKKGRKKKSLPVDTRLDVGSGTVFGSQHIRRLRNLRSRRKDEGDTRGTGASGVGKHIQKLAVPPYLSSAMLAAAAFSLLQERKMSNGMTYFDSLIRLMGWLAIVWNMVRMYSTYLFCAGHGGFCGDVYRIWVYMCDENNGKAVSQFMSGERKIRVWRVATYYVNLK